MIEQKLIHQKSASVLNLQKQAFATVARLGGTIIGLSDYALGAEQPNLLTSPEFAAGLADAPVRAGLVTLSGMAGYDNALAFGHDGSTLSYALKSYAHTAGLSYTMSVIVEMTDGLAPSWGVGGTTGGLSPFAIVGNGQLAGSSAEYVVTQLAGSVYRVSWTYVASGAVGNCGVYKYATNNSRTFRVTGYKLEVGSVATPYTPQVVLRQRGTYQDTTGAQPVTAVADLIGLITDKSYGGQLGVELLSPVWTSPSAGVTQSGNNLIFTAAPAGLTSQGNKTVGNKTYALRITVDSISGGALRLIVSGGQGTTTITTPGTYTAVVKASDADGPYVSVTSGTVTAVVSSTSVREVPGNHATQSAVASKPSVQRVPKRLGPNLVVDGTFDGGTTLWTVIGGVSQSVSGGVLTVTSVGAAGGSYQDVLTQASTVKITVRARNVSGGGSQLWGLAQTGGFANSTVVSVSSTSWQDYSMIVNRIGGASGVRVYLTAQTNPGALEVESVEAREVLEWANAISFGGFNDVFNW